MTVDSPAVAARTTAPPWRLVAAAIGDPRAIAGKFVRLARTVRLWLDPREARSRLGERERKGFIDQQPGRWQIVPGGFGRLRFVIEPASRVVDDPVSVIDPTASLSGDDTVLGHVMQVVHLNPVYDLQLLPMFPDGLDPPESQVAAMLAGTHPHRGAIVEDPAHHARLLDSVRRYRRVRAFSVELAEPAAP